VAPLLLPKRLPPTQHEDSHSRGVAARALAKELLVFLALFAVYVFMGALLNVDPLWKQLVFGAAGGGAAWMVLRKIGPW
jgi:hypothetical protein